MKINQLTFTRFLASIAIVIYHYGLTIAPFDNEWIHFLFKRANVGVSFFFILSGFVMIIAYGNKPQVDFFDYMKNRFARIYPVYLLGLLGFLFYLLYNHVSFDWIGLPLGLLALQSWVPGQALSLNYPGWSLSVEFFFYATFPFLLNYLYKKHDYKKLIIPFVLFWLISQIASKVLLDPSFYQGFPSKSHDFIFYYPLMHFNEFLIGNLAGLFFIHHMKMDKTRNYDWWILGLFSILLVVLKYAKGINMHNGALAVLFVPLIVLLALNKGRITQLFNLRPFIFLGEISFGIYILQLPVFVWSKKIYEYIHFSNPVIEFHLYLLLLILAAGVSYVYIETPLRNMIKNRF